MAKDDKMRDEYDFSGGTRGKYFRGYADGSNVVVLDPDVAKAFKNSEQVNDALRKLARERDERPENHSS